MNWTRYLCCSKLSSFPSCSCALSDTSSRCRSCWCTRRALLPAVWTESSSSRFDCEWKLTNENMKQNAKTSLNWVQLWVERNINTFALDNFSRRCQSGARGRMFRTKVPNIFSLNLKGFLLYFECKDKYLIFQFCSLHCRRLHLFY